MKYRNMLRRNKPNIDAHQDQQINKDDDRYEYGSYLRSNEHSLSSSEN